MEQFRSTIHKLEEDLSRAQKDLETTTEVAIIEYRESEAFEMEIVDGSVVASEIAFFSLLDRLASDHPTLDSSSYTLEDVLGVHAPGGVTFYPSIPGPLIAQSSEAFPVIPED